MLIVSQDRTKILNFDNIEVIGIGNPLENDNGKFQILVDTTNDNEFSIAEYETEERAKEILNGITEMFGVDSINNSTYELADITMKLKHLKIYRMPEK